MWGNKMYLARRKKRKHCTSAEEYDISAHEDTKTSAIFFLGNKGSTPLYAPYLGKPIEHYNFQKTWKGIRESFLNTVWDLNWYPIRIWKCPFYLSVTKQF